MATIAAATAGDVSDAENGSSPPGQMQDTAGPPAGNGRTESGLRISIRVDEYGWFLISCPRALRIMCAAQKKVCIVRRLFPVVSPLLFPPEDPLPIVQDWQSLAHGVN
ncbi:MAG: hypothetical protein ACYTGA_06335 [Planctomycetota bacterium]|jgi:hypothetical protein